MSDIVKFLSGKDDKKGNVTLDRGQVLFGITQVGPNTYKGSIYLDYFDPTANQIYRVNMSGSGGLYAAGLKIKDKNNNSGSETTVAEVNGTATIPLPNYIGEKYFYSDEILSLTHKDASGNQLAKNLAAGTSYFHGGGILMINPSTVNQEALIRILGSSGTVENTLELATRDLYTTSNDKAQIVARQYDKNNAILREAILLSTNGNTSFPGTVSAAGLTTTGDASIGGALNVTGNVTSPKFIGDLQGNADTATDAINATNDGDGKKISTTYLKLAGGTMTGNISFAITTFNTNPTDSKGIVWSGGTDGAKIFYRQTANDAGSLVLQVSDDGEEYIQFIHTKAGVIYLKPNTKEFYPDTTNTGSLGTSSYRWGKVLVGTADSYGSDTQGIYWKNGVPTAMTYSLNANVQTGAAGALSYYSTTTQIDAFPNTVGSGTKLWYLATGVPTASTSTVGGTAQPVYLSNGTITALTADKGSATQGVYLAKGVITPMTYSLNATLNSGTVNRLAYYSEVNAVSSGNKIWTNGTKLGINTTSEQSYNFYVNGTSYFNEKVWNPQGLMSFVQNNTIVGNTTDWDTLVTPGCYKVDIKIWGNAATYHSPNAVRPKLHPYGLLFVIKGSDTDSEARTLQVYFPHSSNSSHHVYCRILNNGTWTSWYPIYNGALDLDGGTMWGTINAMNIIPKDDNTYTLGTSTKRWKEIHSYTIYAHTKFQNPSGSFYADNNGRIYVQNGTGLGVEPSTDGTYILKVTGNSLFNGALYFANAQNYYIDNNADTRLRYTVIGGTSLSPSSTYPLQVIGHAAVTGDIRMRTAGTAIYWDGDTYRQRILNTNDSTAHTDVFSFQQSTNTGSTWINLLRIQDDGVTIVTDNTGQFRKNYSAASTVPTLLVGSNNKDVTIWRVYSSDTAYKDIGIFGYDLKYRGTGSGNNIFLTLYADNQTATAQNIAYTVNQTGEIGIRTDAVAGYSLYVNGKVKIAQDEDAISDTTGALQVTGGISVQGASWFKSTITSEGPLFIGSATAANAILYLNKKIALKGIDNWLRINDTGAFTAGSYFGSTLVRTDGQFQVGSGGSKFYANSSGNGYFSNTLGIAGTNTSYQLYVNGNVRFQTTVNQEVIISGGWMPEAAVTGNQDGNDRPGLRIFGYYPQMVLMSGRAGNVNHGATISLGGFDDPNALDGSFKMFTIGTPGYNVNFMDIGYGTSTNPHLNGMNGYGGLRIMRFNSNGTTQTYYRLDACNRSNTASYMESAIQIRERGFGGAQDDTWATAPRLSWHWSGRVQTQIALASNNELYLSKDQFAHAYKLLYENGGTWNITAANADTVDGYHASQLWRSDGATWNAGADVICSGSSTEWSFDINSTGGNSYWHVWSSNQGRSMLACYPESSHVAIPIHLYVGGYNHTGYALSTSSFICNSWIRTTGNTGWYNESYGGGIYMVDSTWIRTYNGKNFYCDATMGSGAHLYTDGYFRCSGASYTYGHVYVGSNNKVHFWEDNEGGNIQIIAPNGKEVQMDMYDSKTFRIYSWNDAGNYVGISMRRSDGHFFASAVHSAIWNDYAEYRESDTNEPGYVVYENGDDTLSKTTERLQHFAGIISDTFGFCEGETEKAKTPLAVAGRVLAYPYQDRNNYKPGDCVCAAPCGTVDIMTREEVIQYPDRIVGTVSCVPKYEVWGTGNVKVNGRIWIKVR